MGSFNNIFKMDRLTEVYEEDTVPEVQTGEIVFIQIPCLNEESSISLVLESLPKRINGVDRVQILVIDDGSTDKTVEIAKQYGVDHIIRHSKNMGLARSFHDGINYALLNGGTIVVNIDGDNQYPGEKIEDLIQPILEGKAEIVIADRQTNNIAHFSPLKKILQRVGTRMVNMAANTNVPDAASGFRAYSKKALLRLNTITQFSYCMETIIQAGNKRIPIESIKIETNPKTRPSRLFKHMGEHIYRSASAIVRGYIMYKPHVLFINLGIMFSIGGLIPFIRYLIIFLQDSVGGHVQSLLIGLALLLAAMISFALAVFSDLMRTNRTLLEDLLERTKRLQFKGKHVE